MLHSDSYRDRAFTAALVAGGLVSGYYIYRTYLARIVTSRDLPASFLRRKSLLGHVVKVGDGDNFRLFHTPGGYWAGWGWLRAVPRINQRGVGRQTLHIRLNGVDAPECAHFGNPAQPYSTEALNWLRSYLLGKRVRVKPLVEDQYGRTVASVKVWKWNGRRDVSTEMVRRGWAVVYEGKMNAEFEGKQAKLLKLEAEARRRKWGMWATGKGESPGEYKKRVKRE
ncbi:putative endonuclease LCL3 [Nadsonia fulvescens var. elongata DSM 6958]|uniref:Probable endonuclease LCL3 n=1 Tax=Nadsonia fulvescens var. elongata DSM 6958 TaxID=857566 RepID=A0A1E3PLL8_9ASCO|nr:putative endonuclease LCL3 [Nadsonia fulvescens var. elongata DSM 6958]